MGHSAGGVFTQVLLDHGFGAAGVAINSAPTEGVKRVPLSQIKATFPVLKNPANRHRAVGFTHEQWHYAFTNGFSEEESRALYERYHIPASGPIFWGSALANIHPGKDDNWVDYDNDDRAPLLFISGSDDHLMPPKIQQSNAKHYKSDTVTEVKEFDGPAPAARRAGLGEGRRLRARLGARARDAAERGRRDRGRGMRLTHIGGPTVLDRGRRLAPADRPDVRPARPAATASAGGRRRASSPGPAIAADELGPIDAVLLSHDHHDDNLDPPGRALLPSRGRRRHDRVRAPAPRRRARAASRRGRRRGSTRPDGDRARDHRDAVPARAAAQPADRRRRDRLRAALGGPASTARCGSPATPSSTTASARSRTASTSTPRSCTSAACGSRSPGRCATR